MAGSHDYNGWELVAVVATFLALTYTSVALRFYVRIAITKSIKADDYLIVAAQLVFTIFCFFLLAGVSQGLGRHNDSVPEEPRIQALKYQALATAIYPFNMMVVKLSIAVFLLRISFARRYTWTLYVSMVIITIWSLATALYFLLQCQPVQAQWDYRIKDPHCVSGDSVVMAAYSISAVSILSDWLYALMPIPMIWSVRMSTPKKITVAFILALGIFASIATIIRIKFLIILADLTDALYTGTTAMVWTVVEPGVAITAASLVTIRPLLRALHVPGFDVSFPYNNNNNAIDRHAPRSPTGPRPPNILSLRSDISTGGWQNLSFPGRKSRSEVMVENREGETPEEGQLVTPLALEEGRMEGSTTDNEEVLREDSSGEILILQGTRPISTEGIRKTVDFTLRYPSSDGWNGHQR